MFTDHVVSGASSASPAADLGFRPSLVSPVFTSPSGIDPQLDNFRHELGAPQSTLHPTTTAYQAGPTLPPQGGVAQDSGSSDDPSECSCLQQLTNLLCSLKRSQALVSRASSLSSLSSVVTRPDGVPTGGPKRGGSPSSLGRILTNTQEALRVCRTMVECQECVHDDDQEVVLLALMCIRAVLSHLQNANWSGADGGGNNSASNAGGGVGSGLSGNMVGDDDMTLNSKSKHNSDDDPPPMLVGDFEVTGHDKAILLQALRSITLRKIEHILMFLGEMLQKTAQPKEPSMKASRVVSRTAGRGGAGAGGEEQQPPRREGGRAAKRKGVAAEEETTWMEQPGGLGNNLPYAEQMIQGLVSFVGKLQGGPPNKSARG